MQGFTDREIGLNFGRERRDPRTAYLVVIFQGGWRDPRTDDLVGIFKGGWRDLRTVDLVRILKKGKRTHGRPNRSKFWTEKTGTHGQPIWSEFLQGDEGIHGPTIWSEFWKRDVTYGPSIWSEFKKGMKGSTDRRFGRNFWRGMKGPTTVDLVRILKGDEGKFSKSPFWLNSVVHRSLHSLLKFRTKSAVRESLHAL